MVRWMMLLALAGLGSAAPLMARQAERREAAVPRGGALLMTELALRQRERLGLTESQVQRLETLRTQQLEQRLRTMREALELQSRVRAGQAEPEELRRWREAQREAARAEPAASPLAEILSEEQLRTLRTHAVRRLRGGAWRGPRAFGPGVRPWAPPPRPRGWIGPRGRFDRWPPGWYRED
jgi:hypothetical protein